MFQQLIRARSSAAQLLLAAFLLAVALTGAQAYDSPASNLLGKWKEVGKTEVIEFYGDGRISITDKGRTAPGTWATLDDGRLKIEATIFGMTMTGTATVQGDQMAIDIMGTVSNYQKMAS